MTRDSTYGENMARWERDEDERYWKQSFQRAIDDHDFEQLEELIIEGLEDGYDFPYVCDSHVLALIRKHQTK